MHLFPGFPEETVTFLSDLAKNNKKVWFDAHRADYDKYIMEPAMAFTEALGERLITIAPGIIAEPRVNGSILIGSQKVHSWLFAQRKAKSVIFPFLTDQ